MGSECASSSVPAGPCLRLCCLGKAQQRLPRRATELQHGAGAAARGRTGCQPGAVRAGRGFAGRPQDHSLSPCPASGAGDPGAGSACALVVWSHQPWPGLCLGLSTRIGLWDSSLRHVMLARGELAILGAASQGSGLALDDSGTGSAILRPAGCDDVVGARAAPAVLPRSLAASARDAHLDGGGQPAAVHRRLPPGHRRLRHRPRRCRPRRRAAAGRRPHAHLGHAERRLPLPWPQDAGHMVHVQQPARGGRGKQPPPHPCLPPALRLCPRLRDSGEDQRAGAPGAACHGGRRSQASALPELR
mmetsp:Transcript_63999/g.187235  ORF Transcript_63999/g.187235 Transcript_63999/m.187235 type:complete len:303 (-) Transcript_63999:315-1223(-)